MFTHTFLGVLGSWTYSYLKCKYKINSCGLRFGCLRAFRALYVVDKLNKYSIKYNCKYFKIVIHLNILNVRTVNDQLSLKINIVFSASRVRKSCSLVKCRFSLINNLEKVEHASHISTLRNITITFQTKVETESKKENLYNKSLC